MASVGNSFEPVVPNPGCCIRITWVTFLKTKQIVLFLRILGGPQSHLKKNRLFFRAVLRSQSS